MSDVTLSNAVPTASAPTVPASAWLAETHSPDNLSRELCDYNLYAEDAALRAAVAREGGGWGEGALHAFGALCGTADYLALGRLANHHPPEFDSHDRFGRRTDLVSFHPAYHQLMGTAITHGLHASPWTAPGPGAHVVRAAHSYLHTQVEAGHGCPVTMTFACLPTLRLQPALARLWEPGITARVYDPRNLPMAHKQGLTIGMAMTEKQGGSDVRANSTRAYPLGSDSGSEAYELVGHKYFVSAPMCDAFLVLAQAPAGLTCFLLPRWRPDGSKNALQVLRLKPKMGNVSNASSETELRGALAWRVGEEGRGVRTIIEMVSLTRFDCMVGSSAGMRMAVSQALHHCAHRAAFGKLLNQQPLMQNVLADLALESEAALTLTLRMARALDQREQPQEDLLARLVTAVGKYWICKRTPQHAYEAMECIGGSGVMESSMMPRLYREAPSMPSGRAAATFNAWTCCAQWPARPRCWTPTLPSWPWRAAATRCWTALWSPCSTTWLTCARPSTGLATWWTAWRWRCRRRCCCAMHRALCRMPFAGPGSMALARATGARCQWAWMWPRSSRAPRRAPPQLKRSRRPAGPARNA